MCSFDIFYINLRRLPPGFGGVGSVKKEGRCTTWGSSRGREIDCRGLFSDRQGGAGWNPAPEHRSQAEVPPCQKKEGGGDSPWVVCTWTYSCIHCLMPFPSGIYAIVDCVFAEFFEQKNLFSLFGDFFFCFSNLYGYLMVNWLNLICFLPCSYERQTVCYQIIF